jgi:mevalonate kinase
LRVEPSGLVRRRATMSTVLKSSKPLTVLLASITIMSYGCASSASICALVVMPCS